MARRLETSQLENEIRLQIEKDRTVHEKTRDFAEEVADHVRLEWDESGPHPYETGRFRESISVVRTRAQRGFSSFEVRSDDPNAGFIEHGTGPDKPGGHSPYGPNTPTPEFAPFAKTAHHYGGTSP